MDSPTGTTLPLSYANMGRYSEDTVSFVDNLLSERCRAPSLRINALRLTFAETNQFR